ncbi:MAG TPA: transglycosylase SLT domain-containing protein [Gemmatimonadales bacterium]|nr:transglycosylase SLT domain-containing protein [Gemmatimonadales bacterium]
MIRLKVVSGSRRGNSLSFNGSLVRIGRSQESDLRFDDTGDSVVSTNHAQLVLEHGTWQLIDNGSTNGTLLNGKKITKHEVKSGDRIRFGFPGGPEAYVEIGKTAEQPVIDSSAPTAVVAAAVPGPQYDAEADAQQMVSALASDTGDTGEIKVAAAAAQQVAEERAKAGGQSSGQTMFIIGRALNQIKETAQLQTKKRWTKVVAMVGGGALFVILILGAVILYQQRQINRLVSVKTKIDAEILDLQERMQAETDSTRLAAMEDRLAELTGHAENTLEQISAKDKKRADQLTASEDELDQEIRRILAKFNASTYAIPPIFRERLQAHIDELKSAGNLRFMYGRKQRYWPVITKDFAALGLPDEMAYIAWVESGFDPTAQSDAGAAGLWQMTTTTAQQLGLKVNGTVDERMDPDKQTRAAARYLANLLAEFGEDSFMLAMASYNRGENGVRRVLRQIAAEPGGFRKEKRDFWHLYRLKLLPEETREYVPKVLAAAIVCNNPEKYGLAN